MIETADLLKSGLYSCNSNWLNLSGLLVLSVLFWNTAAFYKLVSTTASLGRSSCWQGALYSSVVFLFDRENKTTVACTFKIRVGKVVTCGKASLSWLLIESATSSFQRATLTSVHESRQIAHSQRLVHAACSLKANIKLKFVYFHFLSLYI